MQRLQIPTRRSTALAPVLQGELPFVSFFAATAATGLFGTQFCSRNVFRRSARPPMVDRDPS
jgi:hypothetical protein